MGSALDDRYSSQRQSPPRRARSPRILATVKGLVQRPTTRFASLKRPGSAGSQNHTFHGDDVCIASTSSRPKPQSNRSQMEVLWKRRGQTPEMDEYLTLTELENVWNRQDSYSLCVCAPQNITQYTFHEAVEVPLIAMHDVSSGPTEDAQPEPARSDRIPQITVQEDSSVVDGDVHPALRPYPYLSPDELPTYKPPPPRLVISVPNTNWTYGSS